MAKKSVSTRNSASYPSIADNLHLWNGKGSTRKDRWFGFKQDPSVWHLLPATPLGRQIDGPPHCVLVDEDMIPNILFILLDSTPICRLRYKCMACTEARPAGSKVDQVSFGPDDVRCQKGRGLGIWPLITTSSWMIQNSWTFILRVELVGLHCQRRVGFSFIRMKHFHYIHIYIYIYGSFEISNDLYVFFFTHTHKKEQQTGNIVLHTISYRKIFTQQHLNERQCATGRGWMVAKKHWRQQSPTNIPSRPIPF